MATVDPLAIALQFIDGYRDNDWETARAAMHDDMVHVSPTDHGEMYGSHGIFSKCCMLAYPVITHTHYM